MKRTDVKVGGRYTATVAGRLTTVRIVEINEVAPAPGRDSRRNTMIYAVNERTGRRVLIRSLQQLGTAADGCEFCRADFNRPAGRFVCPYCGQVWPGHAAEL